MATGATPSSPGTPPTRSKAPSSAAIATLVPSAEEYECPPKEKWRVPSAGAGPSWQWCRRAAILSSLKRPPIMSPFSAMKGDGTDGGVAVEAVGGRSAGGRREGHAAGGGAG